jgi:hypothetical protein
MNGQWTLDEIGTVLTAADSHRQRELSGTVSQILDPAGTRPTPAHAWNSFERLQRPD